VENEGASETRMTQAQIAPAISRERVVGIEEAFQAFPPLSSPDQPDLRDAIERASRYRAFSLTAVERILAASAQPRSALESVDDQVRQHLDELLRQNPRPPRATGDYQHLIDWNL
jgi:hypothetical protein